MFLSRPSHRSLRLDSLPLMGTKQTFSSVDIRPSTSDGINEYYIQNKPFIQIQEHGIRKFWEYGIVGSLGSSAAFTLSPQKTTSFRVDEDSVWWLTQDGGNKA